MALFGIDSGVPFPERFVFSHKAWDEYMADVWHDVLCSVSVAQSGTLIEVGPGSSVKIPLALAKMNFRGTLYIVDPAKDVLAAVEALYRNHLPDARIHAVHRTLRDCLGILPEKPDCLLSNHPLDDMILAGATPLNGLSELFDWTSVDGQIVFSISLKTWKALESSAALLQKVKKGTQEEWQQALTVLRPASCIISQYASVILNENEMGSLNNHAKELLRKLKEDNARCLLPDLTVQAVLSRHENFNNAHIGTEVLNAANWLVLQNC